MRDWVNLMEAINKGVKKTIIQINPTSFGKCFSVNKAEVIFILFRVR